MKKNNKILVTGGDGRFATEMKKKYKKNKRFVFLNKKKLNVLSLHSIRKNIKKYNPNMILHLAALSRPMKLHYENLDKSISTNIIGTSNLVLECSKSNIKIVYFSTQYVYPGEKGNYRENSPLLPMNNYAWSKLGGECAVQMYKNSLILRVSMSEKPWIHPVAFKNIKTNFLYHDEVIKLLPKLLENKGIINVGSKSSSIIKFAKKTNKLVKPALYKNRFGEVKIPKNSATNVEKLNKILDKSKS